MSGLRVVQSTGRCFGRMAELTRVTNLVEDAARGHGQVLIVCGDPGVGKTTLAAEGLQACELRGFRTLVGAAEEIERHRPFGVVADTLGLFRARDRRRREIAALLRGDPEHETLMLAENAALEFRVAELAVEYVEGCVVSGPMALVFEDLHWADASSLVAINRLAREAALLPLLIVITFRSFPKGSAVEALVAALERRGAARLDLEPLSPHAVEELVADLAGAPAGPNLMRQVAAAGGNPLHVAELVSALLTEGTGAVSEAGLFEIPEMSLSPSLRLTILRRVSLLPHETLQALRLAAVLGSPFAVTELAWALRRPPAVVATVLGPALAAAVLRDDGTRLAFRHDLIRDAIYEDMPAAVRTALHRDVATVLADRRLPASRVAAHLLQSAQPGDVEAVQWLRRAAREAAPRAPAVAADLLAAALDLTAPDDPVTVRDILAELVPPLMWTGRGAAVEAVCRQALAAGHSHDREGLFRFGLARALFIQGRLAEARAAFEDAAQSPGVDAADRALVAAYFCYVRVFLGEVGASAEARNLMSTLPPGPAPGVARVAVAAGDVLGGRPDAALDALGGLIEATEAGWLPDALWRGFALTDLDRLDEARSVLQDGLRKSLDRGTVAGASLYHAQLALVEYLAGRFDSALAEHVAGMELAEETGQRWRVGSLAVATLIAVHRGQLPEADRLLTAVQAELADVGPQLGDALAGRAMCLLAEARGNVAGASAAAAEALPRYLRGFRSHLAWHAADLARVACAAGDRTLVQRVATAAADLAILPVPSWRGAVFRCRGLVEDDPDRLLEAVSLLRECPRPVDLAYALEDAAVALARAKRESQGRSVAAEALDRYTALGAAGDAARALARLRSAGLRLGARGPRRRPAVGWDSLTESELRVVRLVAEGRPNPEIASRLYLTRRTVRAHVSSALQKLGLTSRVELAAEAVRYGLR